MPSVRFICVLTEAPATPAEGTLDVEVIDTGRADADAPVIARGSAEQVRSDSDAAARTIVLEVPQPPRHGHYAVQAHWALAEPTHNAPGNYRTMEHIPVTAAAVRDGETIEVRLRPIT